MANPKKSQEKAKKKRLRAARQQALPALQAMSIEQLQARLVKYGLDTTVQRVLSAKIKSRGRKPGTSLASRSMAGLTNSSLISPRGKKSSSRRKGKHAQTNGPTSSSRKSAHDPLRPWSSTYDMPEYDFE
jgi:hypothetical protein